MSILLNKDSNQLYFALKSIIESKLGTFPEIGIVAGQAVASALLEHLKLNQNNAMPFNDIDIFINEENAPYCEEIDLEREEFDEDGDIIVYQSTQNKLIRSGEKGKLNFLAVDASYNCELFDPSHKNGYSINYSHNHQDNPNVNIVRISMLDHRERGFMSATPFMAGRGQDVIAGFDINACQIALDTSLRKVVWTKEFEEFVNTLELKASFLGTPMHTAVRLLKKHDEIPFLKFDLEKEMLKLQSARQVFINMENHRELQSGLGYAFMPGNLFSESYLPKIEKYWGALSKYFKLNRKKCFFNSHLTVKKEGSDETFLKERKVERMFYAFTPINYDNLSVSSFVKAFFVGNNRPSCEDINRLFGIWFDASQRIEGFHNCVDLYNSGEGEETFRQTWFRINANDNFDAIEELGVFNCNNAFRTYSSNQSLFNRFVSDGESMLTIIKRASNVSWAKVNGFNYYLSLFTAPNTYYLMPKEKEGEFSFYEESDSECQLKEAMKAHYVNFDDENFAELMYEANKQFIEALKEVKSQYVESSELNASQFSTGDVSAKFMDNAYDLFLNFYLNGDFNNYENTLWCDSAWNEIFKFSLGGKVFLSLEETGGMRENALFSIPVYKPENDSFAGAVSKFSYCLSREHHLESVLSKGLRLTPTLKERCECVFENLMIIEGQRKEREAIMLKGIE